MPFTEQGRIAAAQGGRSGDPPGRRSIRLAFAGASGGKEKDAPIPGRSANAIELSVGGQHDFKTLGYIPLANGLVNIVPHPLYLFPRPVVRGVCEPDRETLSNLFKHLRNRIACSISGDAIATFSIKERPALAKDMDEGTIAAVADEFRFQLRASGELAAHEIVERF